MPKRKLDAPAVIFTDVADSEDVDGQYVKTARLLGAVMKLTFVHNHRVQFDLYSVGLTTVFRVRSR